MSAVAADLNTTTGFVVADNRGRVVGRVESPMYGLANVPDALAVRRRRLSRHLRPAPRCAERIQTFWLSPSPLAGELAPPHLWGGGA